jgi:hypothetical protein
VRVLLPENGALTMQAVDTTEGELVHDSGRLPGPLSL